MHPDNFSVPRSVGK